MKIAVAADDPYGILRPLLIDLADRGHRPQLFGAAATGASHPWPVSSQAAARAVAQGACDQGVIVCWSGTGASIAANKVAGVRAALCVDAGSARAAREWNDANVLVLAARLTTPDLLQEILAAWFASALLDRAQSALATLLED